MYKTELKKKKDEKRQYFRRKNVWCDEKHTIIKYIVKDWCVKVVSWN